MRAFDIVVLIFSVTPLTAPALYAHESTFLSPAYAVGLND